MNKSKKEVKKVKEVKEKVYEIRDYNEAVYLLAKGFDISRIEFRDMVRLDIGTFIFKRFQKDDNGDEIDAKIEGENFMKQSTLVKVQAFISAVNFLQRKLNRAKEARDAMPSNTDKNKKSYF